MTAEDWHLVWFSLRMAVLSTLVILPPGLALAWLLARHNWPGKALIETLVSLPIVLPPVVTGLVLLQLFGKNGPLGHWWYAHFKIVFTWKAVVLALGVMSFPFLVRSARVAFAEVNASLEQMARTLGAGEWRVFFTISLPLARRGVLAGILLAFARALGEFGATIMVAGNIIGQTTTMPVAIYQYVENGEDGHAWALAGVSLVIAFVALWFGERLQRRPN